MKATTLLERQHRNLCQLCEAVERGSASMRDSLLPQLAGDLVAHIAVEEQLFYPALSEILEEGRVRDGRARHAQAQQSLDRALRAPVDGEEFAVAIRDLRLTVEQHAQEEESLFPKVDRALDQAAMRRLSDAMMSLYHTKVEAGYVPPRPSTPRLAYFG